MTKPEIVEVGTRRMREIFEAGVEYYQPTIGGHDLLVESCTTDLSSRNIATIMQEMRRPAISVELGVYGPGIQLVYFQWSGFECYTATGFSWGYGGTGPHGLAKALVVCGLIEEADQGLFLQRQIVARPCQEGGILLGDGYCPFKAKV